MNDKDRYFIQMWLTGTIFIGYIALVVILCIVNVLWSLLFIPLISGFIAAQMTNDKFNEKK